MTNLICPLCGRRVNQARFDPSGFDLDISAVEVVGLGRGRGFKEVSKFSILRPGDATVELIKNRILGLSEMLVEHGCLKPEEVTSNLRIEAVHPKEIEERNQVIASLSKENASLKTQVDDKEEILRSKDGLITDLTNETINLNATIGSLRRTMARKDKIVEDLTEDNIDLKVERDESDRERENWREKYDHRTEQARKLYMIAEARGDKIGKLEAMLEDYTEELI